MIAIEIFNHSHVRIEKQITDQSPFKVGRHSSNDLVILDPSVPLFWFEIEKNDDFWTVHLEKTQARVESIFEHKVEKFYVRFTNLDWLDQATASSESHEIKPKIKNFSSKLQLAPTWILYNFLYLIYFATMTAHKLDWVQFVEQFISINLILLAPALVLSLLSQAINKDYRFQQIVRVLVVAAYALSAVFLHFLGLRWILPDFLNYQIVTQFIELGIIVFFLYWISSLIFDHIRKSYRFIFLGLISAICFFWVVQKYIPLREQYHFLQKEDQPLLYPLFDRREISADQLFQHLDQQMSHQSQHANDLKLKIKESAED